MVSVWLAGQVAGIVPRPLPLLAGSDAPIQPKARPGIRSMRFSHKRGQIDSANIM